MKSFFSFNEFVTSKLIQKFFWIAMFFLVAICAASFAVALRAGLFDGILSSLMVLILGSIFIRVGCDVVLVLFRIYDVLRDLRDANLRQNDSGGCCDWRDCRRRYW